MQHIIGGTPGQKPSQAATMRGPTAKPSAPQAASSYRLGMDVNLADFMREVIEPSMSVPVLVDFWAPWCGPCKTLGPILERAVAETKNAVRLVKVNIDNNQELAAQLQIQSIPAVYAFLGGQPVDGFVGAVPESRVKSFIQRLVAAAKQMGGGGEQSPLDDAVAQAQELFAQNQFAEAGAIFEAVLQHDPSHITAMTMVGRCYLALQKSTKAQQILDKIENAAKAAGTPLTPSQNADLAALKSGLEVVKAGEKNRGQENALAEKLARNPNDHQARLDLAVAQFAAGAREAAIDHLLDLVARDRKWNEEAARKQLLKFFEAMGMDDPLTMAARKRLSALLFS